MIDNRTTQQMHLIQLGNVEVQAHLTLISMPERQK
jgi:hypothetical protein